MIIENFFNHQDTDFIDNNDSSVSLEMLQPMHIYHESVKQYKEQQESYSQESRSAHSMSEKRRRSVMNMNFEKLRNTLRSSQKTSKNKLIEEAIKNLEAYKEFEVRWEAKVQHLQKRIAELEGGP